MRRNVLVVTVAIAIVLGTVLAQEEHFDESSGKVEPGLQGRIARDQELMGEEAEERGLEDHPRSRQKRMLCNKITGDRLCFVRPFSSRCECGVAGCYNGKCTCNRCG